MQQITTSIGIIQLNQSEQTDNINRPFRYIGLTRKATEPEKYINGTYKSIWVYLIQYTDNNEQIGFEFGYNDEFVRVVRRNWIRFGRNQ